MYIIHMFVHVLLVAAVCNGMTCSGHRSCVNGECVCERLYFGQFCQNKGRTA